MSGSDSTQAPTPGIDIGALDPWLVAHVDGAVAPFVYELIAAGGSNLTYRVTDAAGAIRVLRRPPVGRALESAHDMHREARIMRALGTPPPRGTGGPAVPRTTADDAGGADGTSTTSGTNTAGGTSTVTVPAVLATCQDTAVIGAPFTVMSFVDGVVLRTGADTSPLDPAAAGRATDALIDATVALHTLDLDAVGLADLGRHDGYAARQLARWRRQVELADLRPVPLVAEIHDRLVATLPPERARPALAHGDLRFDNVILTPDLTSATVLDWELCTTGDPIADFAWSLRYWAEPADPLHWLPDPPTLASAFAELDRAEVTRRYAARTGFDLSDLGWYEVFSWWKQACIVEGVHARRRRGMTARMDTATRPRVGGAGASAASDATSRLDAIAARVDTMLEIAHALAADRLPRRP